MENKFFPGLLLVALTCFFCSWTVSNKTSLRHLPADAPPEIVGGWANGFTTFTQIVDAYDGRNLGSTWQSGKFFKFTANGRSCEFYVTGKSQYSSYATQATGTVTFDAGSTNSKGAFVFTAVKAHYKGWGPVMVDRDATAAELKNNLSRKYYYRMDGEWLRMQPGGEPNEYSSSFRKVK